MTLQRQFLIPDKSVWIIIKDGDPAARELFERHYSCYHYADGRKPQLFVGPGRKIPLITADAKALFVWRKFKDDCIPQQAGINCAVFRNEAPQIYCSSMLILEAEKIAWQRWPGQRLYTYVDPDKIRRKRDPGRCFRKAGWRPCGYTKVNRLLILEKTEAIRHPGRP